jgi:hypothetical protein
MTFSEWEVMEKILTGLYWQRGVKEAKTCQGREIIGSLHKEGSWEIKDVERAKPIITHRCPKDELVRWIDLREGVCYTCGEHIPEDIKTAFCILRMGVVED